MKENYAIDYFKFYAILGIVAIHSQPFKGISVFGIGGDDLYVIINTFARFAVPYFFIVAGFLFGKKTFDQGSDRYFKGYVAKLGTLFVSWQAFYITYDLILQALKADFMYSSAASIIQGYFSTTFTMDKIANLVLYGTGGGHDAYPLWYLVALIWAIIIIYLFIKLNKLKLLLVCSLILNLLGLFGQSYSGLFHFPFFTRDTLFFGLFYTTLGCYLARNCNSKLIEFGRKNSGLLLPLFFIFQIIQLIERIITVNFLQGRETNYFLSTIPLSICLFLYVITNDYLGRNSYLTKIGRKAVGIFLIHTFVISVTFEVMNISMFRSMYHYWSNTYIWHFLYTPVVLMMSYFLYNLLQTLKKGTTKNGKSLDPLSK